MKTIKFLLQVFRRCLQCLLLPTVLERIKVKRKFIWGEKTAQAVGVPVQEWNAGVVRGPGVSLSVADDCHHSTDANFLLLETRWSVFLTPVPKKFLLVYQAVVSDISHKSYHSYGTQCYNYTGGEEMKD